MQTIKIAIIDDHNFLIQSIKDRLSFFDTIEVIHTANNGKQAIDYTQKNSNFDLILMDIDMPEMNGIQATKIIKEQFPHIKILMLTIYDDDENIFQAIQAGADGYLLKEINPDDLNQAINDTIQGGAAMTPSIALKTLNLLRNPLNAKKEIIEYDIEQLSKREIEILELLAKGFTHTIIAENLFITSSTVRKHIENIYQKLQVHSKVEAVQAAQKRNII